MPSPTSPLNTKSDNNDEGQEGIVVAIRMRPLNNSEGGKQRVWKVLPQYSSIAQTTRDGKPVNERVTGRTFFTFDKTFGEDVNTAHVYDNVAKSIVSSAVSGLNGTIFAYGQTSSGKTYTMQGSGSIEDGSHAEGGVVHMAAKDIFSQISSQQDRIFLVRASFLEIYNEEVRDLLSTSYETLQVREDPRRGVFVNSAEEIVTDFQSLLKILFHGEKSRQIASTGMNERSSRSHTIFRITIESREREADEEKEDKENYNSPGDGAVRVSTLNLVDLAGSESVRHTGNTGERQKEGGMINQSLLTLSRVIVALGNPNQMHINFRDSKLTRLLQPSLSGNAKMAVICCATPSELYLEETRSTLQFASRAKLVKTNAQVNEVLDDRSIIKRLQRELANARRNSAVPGTEHLKALENRAASAGTAAMEAKAKLDRLKASILNVGYLFGTQDDAGDKQPDLIKKDHPQRARKRRQSDGELFLGLKSPSKTVPQTSSTPSTEPRRKRNKRIQKQVSPKSELNIVREALSSRAKMTKALQNTVKNLKQSISDIEDRFKQEKASNESQMNEFDFRYETLQQDHTKSEMEIVASTAEKEKLQIEGANLRSHYEDYQKQMLQSNEQNHRLSSDLDSVRQQNTGLMADLESFRIQVTEVESLLRAEEDAARTLKDDFEKTEEHLSSVEQGKARVEGEMEALKVEMEGLKSELAISCSGLTDSQQMIESIKAEKEDALQTVSSLEQQLQFSGEQFQQVCTEKESMVTDLESRLAAANQEITVISAEKEEAQQTIATLEQKMFSAEEQMNQVQSDSESSAAQHEAAYKELEGHLSTSRQELESVEVTKIELETTVRELSAEKVDLNGQRQDLEERLSQIESELQSQQEQFSVLQTEKSEVEQQLESTKSESNETTAALEQKFLSAEEQMKQVQSDSESSAAQHEAAYKELEDHLSASRQELESEEVTKIELETTVRELSAEKVDLNSQRQDLEEKLSQLESELQSRQEQFSLLQTEKSEVEQQLESTKSESNEATAALEQKLLSAEEQMKQVQSDSESSAAQHEAAYKELEGHLSASRQELESVEVTKIELETTVRELSAKKVDLNGQRQDLEEKLSQLESELQSQQEQFSVLHTEKSEVEQQLESIKSEVKEKEVESKTVQTEIGDANQTIGSLEQKLETVQKQFESICAEKESVAAELEGAITDSNEKIESLRIENVGLQAKIDRQSQDLEDQNSELQSEIETQKQKLAALHNEKAELDKHLVSVKDELTAAESDKRSSSAAIEDARQVIDSLEQKVSAGEERIVMVCRENETLQGEQEEAYKEVDAAQQSIATLEQKLLQVKEQLQNANSEKETLVSKHIDSLKQLETLLAKSQNELESSNSEKADLIGKMEQVNEEVTEANRQRQEFEQRNSELQSGLHEHKEKLMAIETEKNELENQLAIATSALNSKDDENRALQTTVSDAEETIASMQEQVASAERHVEQMRTDNESIIAEQEEAYKELEARLGDLFKGLESLKSEKGDLETRNTEIEKEKTTLSDERQELEKRNSKLQSELEKQQEQFDAVEEEKNETENLLIMATNDLTTNDAAVLEAQQTIVSLQKHLAAAEETTKHIFSEKESTVSDLEERLSRSHREVESLKSGVYDLETRIEELESGLDCQLQELEEKIMHIQSENEDLKYQVESSGVAAVENRSKVMGIKSMTTAILAEKDTLEAILSESQLLAHQLEDQLDCARAEKEQILTDTASHLDEKQKKLEALTHTKKELKIELSSLRKSEEAAKKIESELKHELSLKENLTKRLQERELEREEATAELEKQTERNRELSRSLADCLPKEKESQLLSERTELKTQNVELKQLLISANESEERSRNAASALESKCNAKARELDDALYRLSQLEEELRLSEFPQGNTMDRGHSEMMDELEAIAAERAELQTLLEHEREEREKSEEELKNRMGEEQRLLIHEAENRMNELRMKAEQLESSLEQSESEGYQARQEAEELRDQNKEIEGSCLSLEDAVSDLKSLIEGQENQVSVLQSELKKAKAESYASKESAIEMKDKMRKSSRENEKVMRESQAISSEVSALKRKIASLERDVMQRREESERLKAKLQTAEQGYTDNIQRDETIKQLQEVVKSKDEHIESLTRAVAKLEGESKGMTLGLKMAQARTSSDVSDDSNRLQKKIDRLNTQMKQKDARIKKLEAVRLTKEQVESIKKLKSDTISFEKKCSSLARKNAELKSQLESSGSGSDSSLNVELSELRFDKQALESKLRKFAAHCQRLEDDKAGMIDAMKSCNIDTRGEDDINDAIISLCDKLTALEETKSRRSSGDSKSLESLREENIILLSKIKKAEEIKQQSHAKVKKYMEKIEELQITLEDTNENANGASSEMSRKLQFLEQENLQLMLDNKSTKKQFHVAREEVEMLRMNAVENPTMDFSTVDFGTSDTADFSSLKANEVASKSKGAIAGIAEKAIVGSIKSAAASAKKRSHLSSASPLGDATNAREKRNRTPRAKKAKLDIPRSHKDTKKTRSPVSELKRTRARTPGLGEAAIADEESTAECKQS